MTTRKWWILTIAGVLAAFAVVAALNFLTDPFGVFGDRVMDWYGYNITNNPRVAKFGYLDGNYEQYNGYILGSSKSSSISPDQLNRYYEGASFYNLMMYGANFAHMEESMYYVIDNYGARHIVLSLGLSELLEYGYETSDEKQQFHAEVSGDPLIPFYAKYLFLNPSYGLGKFISSLSDDMKPKPTSVDVFELETGVYDRSRDDAEMTVNIEGYKNTYSPANFGFDNDYYVANLIDIDFAVSIVRRMKEYCDERGVTFEFFITPNYESDAYTFSADALRAYWTGLADIQSFWNFSGYTNVSYDPRYFYDYMHFRTITGEFVLGTVYDDPDVYRPEGFGSYFTAENVAELSEMHLRRAPGNENPFIPIPILLYHHIVPDSEPSSYIVINESTFRAQMTALKDAGYTALFFRDLADYVDGTSVLPEKPVLITFDDGYESNYTLAFPILEELGIRATISVIGGLEGVKDTPGGLSYMSWDEAALMQRSGLIDIQSHTYMLHDGVEGGRLDIRRLNGEASAAYARLLRDDNAMFTGEYSAALGITPSVLIYPLGKADILAEAIVSEMGYRVSVLTGDRIGYIRRGDPMSLRGLYRINAGSEWTGEELILRCGG